MISSKSITISLNQIMIIKPPADCQWCASHAIDKPVTHRAPRARSALHRLVLNGCPRTLVSVIVLHE